MAEALAAVALLSSIVQLIDFSSKLIRRLSDIGRDATSLPKSFQCVSTRLPLLVKTLQQIQRQNDAKQVDVDIAEALQPIIEGSLDQIKILDTVFENFRPLSASSSLRRSIQAIRSLAEDEKVQNAVNKIEDNIQILVFHQVTQQSEAQHQIIRKLCSLSIVPQAQEEPNQSKYALGVRLNDAPQIDTDAFIGRETELEQLRDWLQLDDVLIRQRIVSIVGMGGMGKTQLSIAFAKQYGNEYSSVFWIDANDEVSLKQSLAAIWVISVGQGKPSLADSGAAETDEKVMQVQRWLSEPDNGSWLLIYDNFDNPFVPGVVSPTAYDIRRYFPSRGHGSILITTRSTRLTFCKQLRLSRLTDVEQSLCILVNRSRRDLRHDPCAEQLARRLDGLPLALTTVGAYLEHTSESCAEYLEAYENAWTELKEDADQLMEYSDRTLFSTWNLSLQHIRSQDSDAADLLGVFAYFSPESIWYELIEAGTTNEVAWLERVTHTKRRFERAMSKLSDYSMLQLGPGGYTLHPCLHDWILSETPDNLRPDYLMIALRSVGLSVVHATEPEYWSRNKKLSSHASRFDTKAVSKLLSECQLGLQEFSSLSKIGHLWRQLGKYETAEHLTQRAVSGYQKLLGSEHPDTLSISYNLGTIYYSIGKYDQAEELYRTVLSSQSMVLGAKDHATRATMHELANTYYMLDQYDAAETLYKRCLAILDATDEKFELARCGLLDHLGRVYCSKGEFERAREMHDQALVGYEAKVGPDHPWTLETALSLGHLYRVMQNGDMSQQFLLRVLSGYEKIFDASHPHVLEAAEALGELYFWLRQYDHAREYLERAVAGFQPTREPDRIWTYNKMIFLGHIYTLADDYDAAEKMYQQRAAGLEMILGHDHDQTLAAREQLKEFRTCRASRKKYRSELTDVKGNEATKSTT